MTLTEAEARIKVCPFMRPITGTGKCQASDCMMWRWGDDNNERGYCALAIDRLKNYSMRNSLHQSGKENSE